MGEGAVADDPEAMPQVMALMKSAVSAMKRVRRGWAWYPAAV